MQATHRKALIDLIEFRFDAATLRNTLRDLPYDYDGEPVRVERRHIVAAIRRYLDGNISAGELEAWADLVEGRPGLEVAEEGGGATTDVLAQLSTPETNGPITSEHCQQLLRKLTTMSIGPMDQ